MTTKYFNFWPYNDRGTNRHRISVTVSFGENGGGWGKELLWNYHLSFWRLWTNGKNGIHLTKKEVYRRG